MKLNTLLIFTILGISIPAFSQRNTEIFLVPALHGLHQVNKQYSYDSIQDVIKRIDPQIIVVEIREEDLGRDSTYLANNYPLEMRMMKKWFPKVEVMGFDWLGKEIEGREIPNNYWKNDAPIKKWQLELTKDSLVLEQLKACNLLSVARVEILKTLSLKEILVSKDSQLTVDYYRCLESTFKGTRHQKIYEFYNERNERLLSNLNRIIGNNKAKRIVFITGDDHFVFLQSRVRAEKLDIYL